MFFLLTIGFARGRTLSAHPGLQALLPQPWERLSSLHYLCILRDSVTVLWGLWEPLLSEADLH